MDGDDTTRDAFCDWYLDRLLAPPRAAVERIGRPVTTLSGGAWWPHDPHPGDVCAADFPALALVMRWGGQMRYAPSHPRAGKLATYSVGQHSCLVYELVTELGGNVVERALALYHDLHESKPPGDVQRPVIVGDGHGVAELRMMSRMAAICHRHALRLPYDLPAIVRHADDVMLATERRDLIAWGDGIPPMAGPPPRARLIEAWDADHTEDAFMRRHAQIQDELQAMGVGNVGTGMYLGVDGSLHYYDCASAAEAAI